MMVKKTKDKTLNIALGSVVVGVVIGILGAKVSSWSQATEASTYIRAALPSTSIDSIKRSPIPGLNEVIAGSNRFYADNSGRYLVFGHIYDTRTRQDLTRDTVSQLPKPHLTDLSTLPTPPMPSTSQTEADDNDGYVRVDVLPGAKDAIQSGVQNGIPLAVFLDPDCPYCQALQAELVMQNHDLNVREYLMPIPELHPDAPMHANTIWCADNPLQALNNYMIHGQLPATRGCDSSALGRIRGFADQQGWQATPTLVRADGAIYEGYMPYNDLVAWAKAGLTKVQGGAHA